VGSRLARTQILVGTLGSQPVVETSELSIHS